MLKLRQQKIQKHINIKKANIMNKDIRNFLEGNLQPAMVALKQSQIGNELLLRKSEALLSHLDSTL